jgi:hypothetical protein
LLVAQSVTVLAENIPASKDQDDVIRESAIIE